MIIEEGRGRGRDEGEQKKRKRGGKGGEEGKVMLLTTINTHPKLYHNKSQSLSEEEPRKMFIASFVRERGREIDRQIDR